MMHDLLIILITAAWCGSGAFWSGLTVRGNKYDSINELTIMLMGPFIWITHSAILIRRSLKEKRDNA